MRPRKQSSSRRLQARCERPSGLYTLAYINFDSDNLSANWVTLEGLVTRKSGSTSYKFLVQVNHSNPDYGKVLTTINVAYRLIKNYDVEMKKIELKKDSELGTLLLQKKHALVLISLRTRCVKEIYATRFKQRMHLKNIKLTIDPCKSVLHHYSFLV